LPVGLRGFIIAAMIAAIMSSIDSTLNSASTLVTMDFVKFYKPDISQDALVNIGRLVTFLFMVFAVLWAPQIIQFETLWTYLQSILAYITPPIVICFILGIFWKRANRHGAFYSLAVGIPIGIIGFFSNEIFGLMDIHFLYACFVLLLVNGAIMIGVSINTEAPDQDVVDQYTWSKKMYDDETKDLEGLPKWQNYRYQSVALLILTAMIVGYFW